MYLEETLSRIKNQTSKFTTTSINDNLLLRSVGTLSYITRKSPLIFLNPTFARTFKPEYSSLQVVNLGSLENPTVVGTLANTQIASSGFYEYDFVPANTNSITYTLPDTTKNFFLSTFFIPDNVSGNKTLIDIQGSSSNLSFRLVDSQLRLLDGDTLVFAYNLVLNNTTRYLLNLNICNDDLNKVATFTTSLINQTTGQITTGETLILKDTSYNQDYSIVRLGAEINTPTNYFDGKITNFYFLDTNTDIQTTQLIFSSNQNLINMAIVQADITTQITPLGVAFQKAREQPNYGYEMKELPQWTIKTNGLPNLLNDINVLNTNGGYPEVWHRPSISVNRNLFTNTETLSTQTLTLPVGFYEFWFTSGAGSITSSNGTGSATNHGAVSAGVTNVRLIEVTVGGTITFTVAGVVEKASLQHSQTGGLNTSELIYQKRNSVAVTPFNLGSGSGATSFNGGTSINQVGVLANNYIYTNVAASSQSITAGGTVTAATTDFTMMSFVRPTIAQSSRDTFIGSVTNGPGLSVGATSGAGRFLQLSSPGTGNTIDATAGAVLANVWQHITVTYRVSDRNTIFYYNGVQVGTAVTFPAVLSSGAVVLGAARTSPYANGYTGLLGNAKVYNSLLTPTQILNIYNNEKSVFGL